VAILSKTLNAANTPNLLTDLDIVCNRRPGRGPALSRLLRYADVTQQDLAAAIDVDHSAVSHWVSEKKNPSYENLRKALAFMRVDHALVVKHLGQVIQQDAVADVLRAKLEPRTIQVTLDDLLKIYTEEDADKREALVYSVVMEPIVTAQAVRAMAGDTKAAQWVAERDERIRERLKLKGVGEVAKPSSRQLDWLNGKVYKDKVPASQENGSEVRGGEVEVLPEADKTLEDGQIPIHIQS